MGILSSRLDNMRVRASSPDGLIIGELQGRSQVRIAFRPGSYRNYDENTLEQQLVGLARRLWVRRMAEYYAAVSEAFGETVTKESIPLSARDVEFHNARNNLVAVGQSEDEWILISLRGMRSWSIQIKDGKLRRRTEDEFVLAVNSAADALIRDLEVYS